MPNKIKKFKRAEYYLTNLEIAFDNVSSQETMTQEEYDEKCKAIVKQTMYVENKAVDVLDFRDKLLRLQETLKGKIEALNNDIDTAEYWIKEAEIAIKEWMIEMGKKKIDIEEYPISLRPSKRVEIIDEDMIEAKYIVTNTINSISKELIKKDIEAGIEVPGARIIDNLNLKIGQHLKNKLEVK